MPGKVYVAIYKGESTIFPDWDKCKKYVNNHNGCVHKSFTNTIEMDEYIKYEVSKSKVDIKKGITIFTDGSFCNTQKRYSCGFVILKDFIPMDEGSFSGSDSRIVSMRNVAGEVLGVVKSIETLISKGIIVHGSSFNIVYDYQGVESWATGSWKRNNILTKEYHSFMTSMMSKYNITFIKVKSHSGDKFNDRADYLAKRELGLC